MWHIQLWIETLRFSCLNKRNVNLIPIWAVIKSCKDFAAKRHLVPSAYDAFGYYSLVWTCIRMALCRFHAWNNQGIIMLSMCASRTVHIYWWLSDYYYIEKTTYPPSGEIGASSCRRGKLSFRCWAFAWLNDCANGDEANVTFVQTQKTQSLYYLTYTTFLL